MYTFPSCPVNFYADLGQTLQFMMLSEWPGRRVKSRPWTECTGVGEGGLGRRGLSSSLCFLVFNLVLFLALSVHIYLLGFTETQPGCMLKCRPVSNSSHGSRMENSKQRFKVNSKVKGEVNPTQRSGDQQHCRPLYMPVFITSSPENPGTIN